MSKAFSWGEKHVCLSSDLWLVLEWYLQKLPKNIGGGHHKNDNDTKEEYRLLHLLEIK